MREEVCMGRCRGQGLWFDKRETHLSTKKTLEAAIYQGDKVKQW